MSLKRRILVGYGVAFSLMAVVVVWAVANLLSLGRASNAILRENYRSILAAENMVNALERQDSGILFLLLGSRDQGLAQFRTHEAAFFEWLGRAKDNITVAGEDELVRAIESGYGGYRATLAAVTTRVDMAVSPRPSRAQLYDEFVRDVFTRVREMCLELRTLNEETMYAASLRAGRVADRAIWSTSGVAASALVLAMVFSLLMANRIVQPLGRFVDAARRISEGDYEVTVPVETQDELGLMAEEFNRMAERLVAYRQMNIEEIIAEKNKGEAILSSIADGLIVFDTDMKVTGINPAARQLLHLGFTESSTLHCDGLPVLRPAAESIQQTITHGAQPDIPDERRIIDIANGETSRHYLFSVTAIRGCDRSVSGAVVLLRDVTRLKEVERLKSEFVMAASHELRTPLTSLGMSVDLLMERVAPDLSDRNRQLLKAAHEEVHRMKALVSNLLDLSKIEAGRIELEMVRVPVATLFDHVQSVFKGQAEMKGVAVEPDLREALPPVRADANKITWVLTNLVSNALRYSREGGRIALSAAAAGPFVHISVHDDGPGIPKEYQAGIFEKFVQVTGQDSGGSGLGLAICREIVRAHGGTIWVESSPGEGSTFTFTLPISH
ncbi:MAG: HAMP domain-containing protein [Lentisphaeria bacterium]|nr:HAMP domain-containing protein [Lentisphaeria bacterium]